MSKSEKSIEKLLETYFEGKRLEKSRFEAIVTITKDNSHYNVLMLIAAHLFLQNEDDLVYILEKLVPKDNKIKRMRTGFDLDRYVDIVTQI